MTAISKAMPLYDPRTGEQDKQVVPPSLKEVADAARVLREGQTAWRALGLEGRIASMRRWADAIEAAAAGSSARAARCTLMIGTAVLRNPPSTRAPEVMRTSITKKDYELYE